MTFCNGGRGYEFKQDYNAIEIYVMLLKYIHQLVLPINSSRLRR